ncbi:hypothetical protein TRAPUB_10185 [Trametes pubescens]|uniref:Uncharacterized protein n=1 Tax=Trametes pubescens TaxID=154538 RepID=A0A1M2W0E7_TRAPU|nr:hypothetical protein TRAPUB_10185 [Trametes pubescens]
MHYDILGVSEHMEHHFQRPPSAISRESLPRIPWKHVATLKSLVDTIYSSLEDRDALDILDADWDPARAFFEERKVRRADLGGVGNWQGWNSELEGAQLDVSPTVHLPHLLRILGPSSLTLYKHILGRRRVLIITLPPVEAACMLCQVAADTCYEEQVSEPVSASSSQNGYVGDDASPRVKSRSSAGIKVLGMVTLNDLDKLEFESKSGRGWIACTTDSIYLDKPSCYDLLIDLRSATPNTRPTFHISKLVEPPSGRGPSYRLSSVRFTWSDVRLVSRPLLHTCYPLTTSQWSELDRILQLDSEGSLDVCCDPSHCNGKGHAGPSSTWTDVWRVYEDVCVMCAGLWMGAWRNASASPYACTPRRAENWGSIRLEGEDDLGLRTRSTPYIRSIGQGIEGRPSGSTLPSGLGSLAPRALRRASAMSAWTWAGGKNGDTPEPEQAPRPTEDAPAASSGMFIPGQRDNAPEPNTRQDATTVARRERQVLTTLALLDAFHANTTAVLSRFAALLETRKAQQQQQPLSSRRIDLDAGLIAGAHMVLFTPKDVMSFELGPFSGLDARFVEWLGEEYGGGMRVLVRRGWKDLVGLILGFG